MTFWTKLRKFPPVLVRLLAREGGEAMTDRQLTDAAGGALSLADIRRLSVLTSWDNVTVYHAHWFLVSCGLDLADRVTVQNANRYMKNPKFGHLRRHKNWPQFKEMLEIYASTLTR